MPTNPTPNLSNPKAKPDLIFLGQGPLADAAKSTFKTTFNIIFHARTASDLKTVKALKTARPELPAILASFGVIIKPDLLDLFEPIGILNLHPSLLPKYRGPSPIESALLNGDTDFSVSIMKLSSAMDAGPIYYQTTFTDLPLDKSFIYQKLATAGATWLNRHLSRLPTPVPQDHTQATYTKKFTKSDGILTPDTDSASVTFRKIVAYQGFPKAKYPFFGQNCLILAAHPLNQGDTAPLTITCQDGQKIAIDRLQPENKRPMDAKSFLNGYAKPTK